jgi:hypothetical protein
MITVSTADSSSAGTQIASPRPVYDVAVSYLQMGFSVVPQLPGGKHPCVKWKPFQEQLPTPEQWRDWGRRWPHAGVAVVLGPVSKLFAIDVDGPEAHETLIDKLGTEPVAPKVLSGSGKPHRYHLFFRYPSGVTTLAKYTPWHKKLEFRGDRGIIILPPSLHKSGNAYRFADGRSFDDMKLPQLPALIIKELATRAERKAAGSRVEGSEPHDRSNILKLEPTAAQQQARLYVAKIPPAVEGEAGDRLTYNVACRLVHGFGLRVEQALPVLQEYSSRCRPPWSEEDLRHKLERAAAEPGERGYLLRKAKSAAGRKVVPGTAEAAEEDVPTPVPALDAVRDVGMIDRTRAELFELVGNTHGLFAAIAAWPTTDELEANIAAGKYATFDEAVHDAAARFGGIVQIDAERRVFALRHFPAADDDGHIAYRVLELPLNRAEACLASGGRRGEASRDTPSAGDWRRRLERAAGRLRLYRAAGLLWYLHARVLALGTGKVLLADRELAELAWGLNRSDWPENWRNNLHAALASLATLRHGNSVRTERGLDINWEGFLLDAVEDLRGRGEKDACGPDCPLSASAERHNHFRVQVGDGFLGRLKNFRVGDDNGHDTYDFHPDLAATLAELREMSDEWAAFLREHLDAERQQRTSRQEAKQLEERLRQANDEHRAKFHGVWFTALLPMVFGDVIKLTSGQRHLLLVVLRELTRSKARRGRRPDRAHVFAGGKVPGRRAKTLVACGLLSPEVEHVAAAGNGRKNWGRGYKLATWMRRAGYAFSGDEKAFVAGVLRFLDDVDELSKALGLILVGFCGGSFFGLDEIRELARSGRRHELRRLQAMCVRFYIPASYLDNWRKVVSGKLAGSADRQTPAADRQLLELRRAMRRHGLTQLELARLIGRDRTLVSRLLAGKRRAEGLLDQALAYLRSLEEPDVEPEVEG